MNPDEIEFLILLKEKIDHIAGRAEVDHEKVSRILGRFLKLSKTHLSVQTPDTQFFNDDLKSIKSDTHHIRFAVELLGDCTINYLFIKNARVQNQLIRDNLRMENSRLSNELKTDIERFYSFCTYAFYQIEELVNYYYYNRCLDFESFLQYIKSFHPYVKLNDEKSINEVKSYIKIKCFELEFKMSELYKYSEIDNIRITRNTESHRCSIIEKEDTEVLLKKLLRIKESIKIFYDTHKKEESGNFSLVSYSKLKTLLSDKNEVERELKFREFLKEKNYNKIRESVVRVANCIKTSIN